MTDHTACARGCTRWGKHLPSCIEQPDHAESCANHATCAGCNPDQCQGCEPRQAEEGHLCRRCLKLLNELLDGPHNRESVAGAVLWLADNLGQHLRSPSGGQSRSSNPGEQFVTVATAMSDLQVSLAEMAIEFAEARSMRPPQDHDTARVAAFLRPWKSTLAAWEPIRDSMDHLIDLRRSAHAACPWRGRDPGSSEAAAALLYLAPAEPTADICDRFGVTETWLRQQKRRGRIRPQLEGVKPLWWRPWSVFEILHPDDAKHHEARLASANSSLAPLDIDSIEGLN